MVGSRAQKKWDLGAKKPQSVDGAAIDPVAYFAQAPGGSFPAFGVFLPQLARKTRFLPAEAVGLALLGQKPFGIKGCHTAHAGAGYGLAVDVIGQITRRKHARD